jgi:hypothetical protein
MDYYVSPTGTGVGTYADPGAWKSAITGGRMNLPGDRIIFKTGTYTDKKAGTPWNKKVVISGVVGTAIAPIYIMGEDGGHAILDLFFDVNSGSSGSAYINFTGLHFKDLDAKIDPTTISEGSAPSEIADWGTGITLGDAPNCKIYHCVIEGGGQALSAFQSADNAYIGWNVVFNYGWYNDTGATRRAHGHGIYLANGTPDGTKIAEFNIFGPGYYASEHAGHYGMHYFSTTDKIQSIETVSNIAYGGVIVASYDFPEDDITMDDCWITSPLVGETSSYDGNGVAFGYANPKVFTTAYATDANQINFAGSGFSDGHVVTVYTDGTLPAPLVSGGTYYVVNEGSGTVELSLTAGGSPIVLTSDGTGNHTMAKQSLVGSFVDNKLFHCVLRATNGIWDALTTSGVTIYKTIADWWSTDEGVTPALQFNEVATFSDVSGGGGTDLSRIDISPYDTDYAHVSIADLDLDGSVNVSTVVDTFLTTGDSYEVYHFRDIFSTTVASGTWEGSLTLSVIETLGVDDGATITSEQSPIDSFVVRRVTAGGGGGGGGAISGQREMSDGLLSATQAGTVAPILLYSASFPDIEVFGWTGYGQLSWANQTWTGYGDLIMIDPVQESTDSAADSLSFTMSGLEGEYYTAILLGDYHGRAAKVWVGALDLTTGQLVDDPYLLFSGVLDSDVIKDTGNSATLRMTLINDVSDQLRARSWQYTHEDQQSLYPGVVDNGLEFVAALQDVEIG